MHITNIKGFGLRRPVRASRMKKIYPCPDFDLEQLKEHILFREAWKENVINGFTQQNDLCRLVIDLKNALDRMVAVVCNIAPHHRQYHSRREEHWKDLVYLWARLMDALSQVNAFQTMFYDIAAVDENYGTRVEAYMSNEDCLEDVLWWDKIYDPGPLPEDLKKELVEDGHEIPDDAVIEYNIKRKPFDYEFYRDRENKMKKKREIIR